MRFFILALIPLSLYSQQMQGPNLVKPPRYTQQQADAAYKYGSEVIGPFLFGCANNPKEIPGIRDRIKLFVKLKDQKRLDYQVKPFRNPMAPNQAAQTGWNDTQQIPYIYVFMPAMQDEQERAKKEGKDFSTMACVTIAHEMIHWQLYDTGQFSLWENAHRFDPNTAARSEATAWGITVIEIIRPLIASRRSVAQSLIDISDAFQMVGNNYRNPTWINAFYKQQRQ